jgi:hypothetical protein
VFLVVLDALQSSERPLESVLVEVPPLPTELAPVLVSLEAPLPELVPEPELLLEPELPSPELLPPLFELAAIADVARPMDSAETARSFNMVFPQLVCWCFTTEQPEQIHEVPKIIFSA